MDLQAGIKKTVIKYEGNDYSFDQCPLDPCVFALRKTADGKCEGKPIGYIGSHVDDLLLVSGRTVNKLMQAALSAGRHVSTKSQLYFCVT